MATSKRPRKPQGDQYKRGYVNGVRAAVDALLDDLEVTGKLDVEYDADGRAMVCIGCLLHGQELHGLADRWEFAMGVKCEPEGAAP